MVHGQVRCSFHSPSHIEMMSFFVLDCLGLGEGDGGNVKLSFLLPSMQLISLLHAPAVIPYLEFFARVEESSCSDSYSN